jgi:hypothetical protein
MLMTIEVVNSPDIIVTVDGPNQVSVEVVRGADGAAGPAGAAGPNLVSGSTTSTLTGWLRADGSTVEAYSFNSTIDGNSNVFIAADDGPKAGSLGAISTDNYYVQFVADGSGTKQFRMRSEYAGYGLGPCSADLAIGYYDGGSPYAALGACNGGSTSGITVTGPYVDIQAIEVRTICQGFTVTYLGTPYTFSETGFEVVSAANAAAAMTTLGGTTVGQNIFTKANPSAVRFLRVNADNTIDFLTASEQDLAVGRNDPTEALRGSYHLLPTPSRPRWDVAENIPSAATGTGFGIGGLDWNASAGNVLSHPGARNGSVYSANRMRTNCIGPTPLAGTQMAQLRTGTRAPISRSSNWDSFGYIMFRMPTLPALSQGWVGWKGTAAEITTTAVLQDTLNCLAMGYEQSGGSYETNWYIYHNDGSGTCTRINLGANFPTSTTAVYCLYICMQANSGNIAYQVNRLDLPQVASGLISSNIIVTDSQMFTHVYQTNGSTAVRCEVEAFHHFAAIKN